MVNHVSSPFFHYHIMPIWKIHKKMAKKGHRNGSAVNVTFHVRYAIQYEEKGQNEFNMFTEINTDFVIGHFSILIQKL